MRLPQTLIYGSFIALCAVLYFLPRPTINFAFAAWRSASQETNTYSAPLADVIAPPIGMRTTSDPIELGIEHPPLYENTLAQFSTRFDSDLTPMTFHWNFGDPSGQNRLLATHDGTAEYTYSSPGEYTISVGMTEDATGKQTIVTQCVVVRPAPIEKLSLTSTSSPDSSTNQLSFIVQAESGNIESFEWFLGDQTHRKTENNYLPHTYHRQGAYVARVKAIGPAYSKDHCGDPEQMRSTVTAHTLALVQMPAPAEGSQLSVRRGGKALPGSVAVGNQVEFYVTGLSPAEQYDWHLGDGSHISSSEPVINYAYPVGGEYVVSVLLPDVESPQAAYTIFNVLDTSLFVPVLLNSGSEPDGTSQLTPTPTLTPNPTSIPTQEATSANTPETEPTQTGGTITPTSTVTSIPSTTPAATTSPEMTMAPDATATPTFTSVPSGEGTLVPTSTPTDADGTSLIPPTPTPSPTPTGADGTSLIPPTPTPSPTPTDADGTSLIPPTPTDDGGTSLIPPTSMGPGITLLLPPTPTPG